jgi:hypothetical protein
MPKSDKISHNDGNSRLAEEIDASRELLRIGYVTNVVTNDFFSDTTLCTDLPIVAVVHFLMKYVKDLMYV